MTDRLERPTQLVQPETMERMIGDYRAARDRVMWVPLVTLAILGLLVAI